MIPMKKRTPRKGPGTQGAVDICGRRSVVLGGAVSLLGLNIAAGALATTSSKSALAAIFVVFGFASTLTFGPM